MSGKALAAGLDNSMMELQDRRLMVVCHWLRQCESWQDPFFKHWQSQWHTLIEV